LLIVAALEQLEAPPDRVSPTPSGGLVVLSLVEALSAVPDPRKPRGVRHGVLTVLLLGACAVPAAHARSSRSPNTPTTPAAQCWTCWERARWCRTSRPFRQ